VTKLRNQDSAFFITALHKIMLRCSFYKIRHNGSSAKIYTLEKRKLPPFTSECRTAPGDLVEGFKKFVLRGAIHGRHWFLCKFVTDTLVQCYANDDTGEVYQIHSRAGKTKGKCFVGITFCADPETMPTTKFRECRKTTFRRPFYKYCENISISRRSRSSCLMSHCWRARRQPTGRDRFRRF